jgi:hypothetical protein
MAVSLFGIIFYQFSAQDLAKDGGGEEKRDEPVGEPAPPAHHEDERDHQVDGQPPLDRELPSDRTPHPEGQRYDKGHRQKSGKKQRTLGRKIHGRGFSRRRQNSPMLKSRRGDTGVILYLGM